MEKLTVDFSVQNSKNIFADLQLLNKKLYDFIQLECTYRKRYFKNWNNYRCTCDLIQILYFNIIR